MRKFLIVAVALLLTAPAFAGDMMGSAHSKGTWTVGHAFGGNTGIGFFYMDNIEVSAGFNFGSNSSDNGGGSVATTSMGFSVGGAYYLSQMGPGIPYGAASLGYSSTSSDAAGDPKSSSMNINIGGGYDWFLTDHVCWFGDLRYNINSGSSESTVGGTTVSNDVSGGGLNFMIGLKAFIF
ncbi:hypothetical protein KQI63_12340 [bacterium]|nr:hypothetical protein [bacterium]